MSFAVHMINIKYALYVRVFDYCVFVVDDGAGIFDFDPTTTVRTESQCSLNTYRHYWVCIALARVLLFFISSFVVFKTPYYGSGAP